MLLEGRIETTKQDFFYLIVGLPEGHDVDTAKRTAYSTNSASF